jgi:outer membrane usher protein
MLGRRRALIALALLASTPSLAQPDKMLLEFCVNGGCYGTAFVVMKDKHVLVDEDSLKRANLPLQTLHAAKIGAREFVDVSLYGGGSRLQIDEEKARLTLVLPATDFQANSIDLDERRQSMVPTAIPSAFMNYAVNVGSSSTSASVYLDAGLAYGQSLLRDNPSWSVEQGFSRGLTRFEYDDSGHDRRLTVGDQYAYSTDGLGGTALIGGIGLSRAFDLDPYLITFPQPTISGLLQAPGTVDIYENGVLVSQRQVPAGPFNLASLGLGAGSNDIRVVVQDPFGGTSTLQQNFYGANSMLRPGLSDYAYQVGFERLSPLVEGYEAARPVVLARENYGVSDFLTAGFRVEGGTGLVNGGPCVNLRLPVGVITAGIAGSDARMGGGYGSSLAYQYNNRAFSLGAGVQSYSSAYRRIGDDTLPASFRPRQIDYVNASWSPLQRLNLQVSAGSTVYADGTRQTNLSLNSEINLPRGMALTFSFTREFSHPESNGDQMTFNLVIPFGRTSVGVSATRDSNDGNTYGFSAQRSVPTDTGWGYAVNGQGGYGGVTGISQADYQSQYGLVQATAQRFNGTTGGNVLVSGAVVALDDHVFVTRALRDGYALIETPGVAGVEITHENQPYGKTDANGNLLVTGLQPYQANKVGINQDSVPMSDQIDSTDKVISVPRLGGTIIRFGVHELRAARGVLMLSGKPVKYGTGRLATKAGPLKTLIGLDGSFYFSHLPAGGYVLRAHTSSGDISCRLNMPITPRPLTNLGKIACSRAL